MTGRNTNHHDKMGAGFTADKTKVFQSPYAHLRGTFPETYKRLVMMKEAKDPPPQGLGAQICSQSLPSLHLPQLDSKAHRRERRRHSRSCAERGGDGDLHDGMATSPDTKMKRKSKRPITDEQMVHQLCRMKAFSQRNPFGGVCEGVDTSHKISVSYR
mmetsp:Transcript_72841/g.115293  ORF Transcript_72841/g.115293 Transcript_72841/m.115293 type:complete len:158 (+) Transcript_72841:100-573(+)